jgi:N-methylhydantoinase B/oxoprolinase/acetone carboxylase alpha subunit
MGQNGAPPAPLPSMHIQRAGKSRGEMEVFRCVDMTDLYSGDLLISRGTGGAGWGSPFDRDRVVKEDVKT